MSALLVDLRNHGTSTFPVGKSLLSDSDPIVRCNAIRIISDYKDSPEAIELLKNAEKDPDAKVREKANQVLTKGFC